MRTRLTIMAIVLAAAATAIGVVVLLVIMLGWLGLAIGALGTIAVLGAYRLWIQPWQHRWGATDQEIGRAMPGDDLIPDAASTTRAITIAAPAEQVWPWLVQLGYGRGGWYSYDWIDNDGQPSADRILSELQQLRVGDQILMLPGMGPASPRGRAQPLLRGRRPGSWRLVPGPVPDGGRLPADQPVVGGLAADPGDRLLDPAQRSGRLHHGTQDAQGHQIPGGGHGPGPEQGVSGCPSPAWRNWTRSSAAGCWLSGISAAWPSPTSAGR